MIRIYGILNNFETTVAALNISLTPFADKDCVFLDLEKGGVYRSATTEFNFTDLDWRPMNGSARLGQYLYNGSTYIKNEVIEDYCSKDGDRMVRLNDGRLINLNQEEYKDYDVYNAYQDYKDCKPVGKIYFKEE